MEGLGWIAAVCTDWPGSALRSKELVLRTMVVLCSAVVVSYDMLRYCVIKSGMVTLW